MCVRVPVCMCHPRVMCVGGGHDVEVEHTGYMRKMVGRVETTCTLSHVSDMAPVAGFTAQAAACVLAWCIEYQKLHIDFVSLWPIFTI